MNRLIIYCDEFDFLPLANAFAGEYKADCNLCAEILFVGEEEIKELNKNQRGIDAVTDVLSFPTLDGIRDKEIKKDYFKFDVDEDGNLFIGSIVICTKRAQEQADEYGHTYNRELLYLATHGLFHLLGFDHMTDDDKRQMRQKEESVLTKINATR